MEKTIRYDFEMFSNAGNNACLRLVNQICKKIDGRYRLTQETLMDMIRAKMEKLSQLHPEVNDTEPGYHIQEIINKKLDEVGYSFRVSRYDF